MARADRHNGRRVWPWIVGLAVLVGAGVAVFLLTRGGGGPLGHPTPTFAFEVEKTGVDRIGKKKVSREDLEAVAGDVAATLDRLYTIGFVDPDEWADGRFPAAADLFAPDAQKGLTENLEDLTLGSTSTQVEYVESPEGTVKIVFLADRRGDLFAAAAATDFTEIGHLNGGQTLDVEHAGRYLLRPEGDTWRIQTYTVEGSLDTGEKGTP